MCKMITQHYSTVATVANFSFLIVNNKVGIEDDLKAMFDIECLMHYRESLNIILWYPSLCSFMTVVL
jgi:hypothetical protein